MKKILAAALLISSFLFFFSAARAQAGPLSIFSFELPFGGYVTGLPIPCVCNVARGLPFKIAYPVTKISSGLFLFDPISTTLYREKTPLPGVWFLGNYKKGFTENQCWVSVPPDPCLAATQVPGVKGTITKIGTTGLGF